MDTLDMHGRFGGAVNLVTSYARNPLRITAGSRQLAVVSDEAFLQLGAAATYDRFRLYVSFDSPLTVQGSSGTIDGYTFTGPSVDPASSPDAVSQRTSGVRCAHPWRPHHRVPSRARRSALASRRRTRLTADQLSAGINDHVGAPEWRLVFGIELFAHRAGKGGPIDRGDGHTASLQPQE